MHDTNAWAPRQAAHGVLLAPAGWDSDGEVALVGPLFELLREDAGSTEVGTNSNRYTFTCTAGSLALDYC